MIFTVGCLKNLNNPCRSCFLSLDLSNFRNKFSLNKNWVLFWIHKKRKYARAWIGNGFIFWPWAVDNLLRPVDKPLSTGLWPVENLIHSFFSVSCCQQALSTVFCAQPTSLQPVFFICFFFKCFLLKFYWVFLIIISYLKTKQIFNSYHTDPNSRRADIYTSF